MNWKVGDIIKDRKGTYCVRAIRLIQLKKTNRTATFTVRLYDYHGIRWEVSPLILTRKQGMSW